MTKTIHEGHLFPSLQAPVMAAAAKDGMTLTGWVNHVIAAFLERERQDAEQPQTCADAAERNERTFPRGTVVRLKSGGHLMTVNAACSCSIECIWSQSGGVEDDSFPPECLEVVPSDVVARELEPSPF